jgi:hypothetical protein
MRLRAILFFVAALLCSGHIQAQRADETTALQSGDAAVKQAVFILPEDGQTCAAGTGSDFFDRKPRCCGQCSTTEEPPRRGCKVTYRDKDGREQTYCSPC